MKPLLGDSQISISYSATDCLAGASASLSPTSHPNTRGSWETCVSFPHQSLLLTPHSLQAGAVARLRSPHAGSPPAGNNVLGTLGEQQAQRSGYLVVALASWQASYSDNVDLGLSG